MNTARKYDVQQRDRRQLRRSVVTLLVVCGLAAFAYWSNAQSPSSLRSAFPSFVAEDVQRIEVWRGMTGAQLWKTEQQWFVERGAVRAALTPRTQLPVSTPMIEQALHVPTRLQVGAVVTSNPQEYAQFGFDANALRIQFFGAQEDVLANIHVGKTGPGLLSRYVRINNDPAVYLVSVDLAALFPTQVQVWANRTIWQLDPDTVVEVQVETRSASITLRKRVDQHFYEEDPYTGEKIDPQAMRDWLAPWEALRAQEYLVSDAVSDSEVSATLRFRQVDGSEQWLEFGARQAGLRRARSAEYSFLLSQRYFDALVSLPSAH